MNDEEKELFDDIEMCLKRISDFLGDNGYKETRKYIERYEHHLNMLKNKDEVNRNELLTDNERLFLKQVLKYGNYKSGTENGVVRYIEKRGYWLHLCFSEFHSNSIYIDKRLHFKGLQEDVEYCLEELGLGG